MKIRRLALGLPLLALLLSPSGAAETTLPSEKTAAALGIDVARLKVILKTVTGADGHIDKVLHDDFWNLFPKTFSENPRQLKDFLEPFDLHRSLETQKECWASIRASYIDNRLVWTPEYKRLREIRLLGEKVAPDIVRRDFVHCDAMISAAADHRPYVTSSGQTMELTQEAADVVLASIPATGKRLEKLLDPVWKE